MAQFKDKNGTEWHVRVDVNVIRAVRSAAGVDLASIIGGDLLGKLSEDPVLLVDVLYEACAMQARARNITPAAFAEAIHGQPVADATDALLEAIADFFPGPKGKLLRAMATTTRTMAEATDTKLTETVLASGAVFSNVPPAPESPTQGHTPGES